MAIARIGAHFCLFFSPKSVTAKNAAAKAASEPAIKESSRYIPFHVLAGKAAHITIAMMSKTMFAVIRRVSVLCELELEDFDIYYQTLLSIMVFINFVHNLRFGNIFFSFKIFQAYMNLALVSQFFKIVET